MTVGEMIKELEKFPKDVKIGAFVSYDNYAGDYCEVSSLYYNQTYGFIDVSAEEGDEIIEKID